MNGCAAHPTDANIRFAAPSRPTNHANLW